MALKTADVDMTAFNDGILKLARAAGGAGMIEALEKVAAFLIGKAAEKSPKDTGALAGSGTWDRTAPTEVTFGFNKEYASIQNFGGAKLPCKGYQSEVGPNLYFTGTLDEQKAKALELLAREIEKALKE